MCALFFSSRKPKLTRQQSLSAIPVRNEKIQVEMDDDIGEASLIIPRRDDWWVRLMSKVFFVPEFRKITLDELGTFVWNQCDGSTTVGEIIQRFAKRYKLERKEAELSMIAFLRQMVKKRLIGLAVMESKASAQGKEKDGGKRQRRRKKKVRP